MQNPSARLAPRSSPPRRRTAALISAALLVAGSAFAVGLSPRVVDALHAWGKAGTGKGQFHWPSALATRFGNIYVVDSDNNRLQEFTSGGGFVREWPAGGDRKFEQSRGMAIDQSRGFIYVAATGAHKVLKYDALGNFIKGWGSFGNGTAQFEQIVGIAVGPDSNIYTVDNALDRVQVFDVGGVPQRQWPLRTPEGERVRPTAIAVSQDGFVYITETTTSRVFKYNMQGQFQTSWPTLSRSPFKIAVSPNSQIVLVTDSIDYDIQVYDSNGTTLQPLSVRTTHYYYHIVRPTDVVILNDTVVYCTEGYNALPDIVKFSLP